MTTIQKTNWVPYSCEQMYHLVNDLEKYPEFVPGCTKTTILSRTPEEIQARIEFSKKGFTHSFATRNRLHQNKRIDLHLLEGPFRQLEGFWQFDEVNKGCQISFKLDFELSNRFLDMTVGPFLQNITGEFIQAFTKRADALYRKT